MSELDNIIAGIGRSRAAAKLKLMIAGWVIGSDADRYSKPGTYVSGGDTRLSILVRGYGSEINLRRGAAILDEVCDWTGVSDAEMKQHDTGTVFVRFTYNV